MTTANGVDVLIVVSVLVLLFAVTTYMTWRRDDRERRQARLVHRNLERMSGGPW